MNKVYLFFVLFLFVFAFTDCKNSNSKEQLNPDLVTNPITEDGKNGELPAFEFEKETHNFENVFAGEVVSYSFKFKNSGKANLIISEAKATCGCTVPEYPKTPVRPGESGTIKVTFNSAGKQGMISKTITLMCNTVPNTKVLTITGFVVAK